MVVDEKNLPGFAMTCQDEDPFSGVGSESVTVRIFIQSFYILKQTADGNPAAPSPRDTMCGGLQNVKQ